MKRSKVVSLEESLEEMSVIEYGRRNFRKSMELSKKLLIINPDSIVALNSLAGIYFSFGSSEKALSYLTRALELAPNDPVVNYNIGIIYLIESVDPEKALPYLKKAKKFNSSKEPYVYAYLSLCNHLLGNIKASRQQCMAAHRLAPQDEVVYNLAETIDLELPY